MSKRKDFALLASGMVLGAALCGGSALAASGITAQLVPQTFYVDGQAVSLTSCVVGGSNYVKLRDIGEAVGFNVYWDGTVQIESDKPYTGLPPADTTQTPDLTEESVQATLWSLMDTYPTGTKFGYYTSTSNGPYGGGAACSGWAALCSDAAFGDLPWRKVIAPSWEEIRPGDLIRYDNDQGGHVVVVLKKTDEYVMVTESGVNNKTRWGGQYFQWWLEDQPGYTLYSRYPR